MRRSGVEGIGDIPWGTHLCHFYSTSEQLLKIAAAYFRAGLISNEYCLWITSVPLTEEHALQSLEAILPNARDYLRTGCHSAH